MKLLAAATDLATTLSATGHTDGDYDLVANATDLYERIDIY